MFSHHFFRWLSHHYANIIRLHYSIIRLLFHIVADICLYILYIHTHTIIIYPYVDINNNYPTTLYRYVDTNSISLATPPVQISASMQVKRRALSPETSPLGFTGDPLLAFPLRWWFWGKVTGEAMSKWSWWAVEDLLWAVSKSHWFTVNNRGSTIHYRISEPVELVRNQ